jgi:cation diffusion facilitator CzcD-associated flavoprotein CzcO
MITMSAVRSGPRIAVIGAGLGGVACAVNLSRAGLNDFTVYEQAPGPGGVWWHNTYPGCEVDVNSQAYSYSFMPYVWRRTHGTQPEVLQYIEEVIDHFDVRRHFRFGVGVSGVLWDESTRTYALDTSDGKAGPFDIVVSCVGMLSAPKQPEWATSALFEGPIFHTARYEHEHDFAGKTVAIVGTGSTACQLAPILAQRAAKLDVYQREPGYVLPKRAREFTAQEQERFLRHPITQKIDRWRLLRQASKDVQAFDVTSPKQEKVRSYHARYLEREVTDPAVREALRPSYPYGCKRPVFASDYYSTFNRGNVELVPKAVAKLEAGGLVDTEGQFRPADAVILATGFDATNYLGGIEVTGRGGRSLHQEWGGEPYAFLGMTVPGFPNFFMLYGPNTNGGWSICAQLERQSELVVRMARRVARSPGALIETRRGASRRYDQWIQDANRKRRSAFEGGCHNYYHSESGKNVTQWPYGHVTYAIVTKLLPTLGLITRRSAPARSTKASEEGVDERN